MTPNQSRVRQNRRQILATIGVGTLSTLSVTGTAADRQSQEQSEQQPQKVVQAQDELVIDNVDITESHGDSPGDYVSTETVFEDDFYVPFSAQQVESGGTYHVTIVDTTNEVMEIESGEFDGSGTVHAWPEFSGCGLIFCWDTGTYRAVVTVTDTANDRSTTTSTQFEFVD